MDFLINKTLAEIVTENYQAASVFEKYGLDFCCKGKKSLHNACVENGLPESEVVTELNRVFSETERDIKFDLLSPGELADYIVREHHSYVKFNSPQLLAYLQRIAHKHGDRHPEMVEVLGLFSTLKTELEEHMAKEEKVVFPRIKSFENKKASPSSAEFLKAPIDVMHEEHEVAGDIMKKIRELTKNYTAPKDACTTFRLALASLEAYEADLHHHVHLENNLLFPKAMKLVAPENN